MMDIQPSCVRELYADPNFVAMTAEYSLHSNPTMPTPVFKQSDYQAREDAGVLDSWAVRVDGKLVGFMAIIAGHSLHFGPGMAIVESLFVMQDYRTTGAGKALIHLAKDFVRNRAFKVCVVQCPYGAPLAKLLEKEAFTPQLVCYCWNP